MKTTTFEEEILKLEPSLTKFALTLVPNKDGANDLVQNTVLKALMNQRKYQANTNMKVWMFTIMKNIHISNYNKQVEQEKLFHFHNNQKLTKPRRPQNPDKFEYPHSNTSKELNQPSKINHNQSITLTPEFDYEKTVKELEIETSSSTKLPHATRETIYLGNKTTEDTGMETTI